MQKKLKQNKSANKILSTNSANQTNIKNLSNKN